MPTAFALFFYGAPVLVALLIIFTSGMALERHRCRSHFHTDDEMQAAERASYQRGLEHGYARANLSARVLAVRMNANRA
jgi:hypothetical protein